MLYYKLFKNKLIKKAYKLIIDYKKSNFIL